MALNLAESYGSMSTNNHIVNDTTDQQGDSAAHSLEKHESGDKGGNNNHHHHRHHARYRMWERMDEQSQKFLIDALVLLEQPMVRGHVDWKLIRHATQLRSAMEFNAVLAAENHMDADAKRFQRLMRSLVQVATAAQLLTTKMQSIMTDLNHVKRWRFVRNKWAKSNLDHVPKDSIMDAISSKDLAHLPAYLSEQDQEAAATSQILDRYVKMDKLISMMSSIATYRLYRIRWHRDEHVLARKIFSDFKMMGEKFREFFLRYLKKYAHL